MDDETRARKAALENALNETDKLIDMFSDVFSGKEIHEHPKRDFSGTALKIMGLKTDRQSASEAVVNSVSVSESACEEKDERLDMSLDELASCASECRRCKLCSTRKNVVFGEGCSNHPDVMVIGEGPGETEDETGRPFVGRAGQYLDSWLRAISLSRDENTYIANIVKCRPPQNRDPEADEKNQCMAFIKQQIELVQPKAILCLGRPASTELTGVSDASMGSLRGKFFFYESSIPMICTYHPAAVLRDPSLRRPVWEDLQKLARYLNLQIATK